MPISPGFSIDCPKRGNVDIDTNNYFGSSTYGEYVTGNSAGNLIFTFGLHDYIKGYGGNYRLYGGSGNDIVEGGADADTVSGGSGNDWLYGDDSYYGGSDDYVVGGSGND